MCRFTQLAVHVLFSTFTALIASPHQRPTTKMFKRDRDRGRETERRRDRETQRQRETERQSPTDRHRQRDKDRHRQTEGGGAE